MYKWIIFCFIITHSSLSLSANKEDASYTNGQIDPTEALKGFIMPLKKGIAGLQEADASTKSMLSENGGSSYAKEQLIKQGTDKKDAFNHSEVMNRLKADMGEKGVLTTVKAIEKDDSKLNGHVQKHTYKLMYSNGKSTTLNFTLLKPTMSGGYFMTDISVVEQ